MTIVDSDTNTRWSLAQGEAVGGPLHGSKLQSAPAYPAFWFGWQGYFPGTEVWKQPQ